MVNERFRTVAAAWSLPRTQPSVNAAAVKTSAENVWGRRVQRKVFRIEQMCAVGRANSLARQHFSVDKLGTAGEQRHTAEVAPMIESELAVIRGAIARNKWELLAVLNEGQERRMARAAGELGVAVESMETAAQKIWHLLRSSTTARGRSRRL